MQKILDNGFGTDGTSNVRVRLNPVLMHANGVGRQWQPTSNYRLSDLDLVIHPRFG
jgi:hypothetical protein